MTIVIGSVEQKRGWFDDVDDWLKRDPLYLLGGPVYFFFHVLISH